MESKDKGFIFGSSEDGTLYFRKKKNAYTIEIEQKVREWLVHIQEVLKREYNKNSNLRTTSRGYYRLIFYSKEIFNEIKEFRKDYRKLLLSSGSFQVGFLQGIFDAEGAVHNKRYQIRIASKNKQTIDVTVELLNGLGVRTGKVHNDNGIFVLPFYGRENLQVFKETIGFRHPEKKKRLSNLLS